jgi:hypothetical protein
VTFVIVLLALALTRQLGRARKPRRSLRLLGKPSIAIYVHKDDLNSFANA